MKYLIFISVLFLAACGDTPTSPSRRCETDCIGGGSLNRSRVTPLYREHPADTELEEW